MEDVEEIIVEWTEKIDTGKARLMAYSCLNDPILRYTQYLSLREYLTKSDNAFEYLKAISIFEQLERRDLASKIQTEMLGRFPVKGFALLFLYCIPKFYYGDY